MNKCIQAWHKIVTEKGRYMCEGRKEDEKYIEIIFWNNTVVNFASGVHHSLLLWYYVDKSGVRKLSALR